MSYLDAPLRSRTWGSSLPMSDMSFGSYFPCRRYEWLYSVISESCSVAILVWVISALRVRPLRGFRRIEAAIRVSPNKDFTVAISFIRAKNFNAICCRLHRLRRVTSPGQIRAHFPLLKTCTCACACLGGVVVKSPHNNFS